MSKVLLIEPPSPSEFGTIRVLGSMGTCKTDMAWPPYDLMIIGGLLDKNGIKSKIIDANCLRLSYLQVKDIIAEERPEIVIFTVTTPTLDNDVKTAKVAKEVSKDVVTVAVSLAMETVRENLLSKYPYLDAYPYHEPELSVLDLIKSDYDPKNVLGIYYREDGMIKKNEPCPKIKNLDDFGIPPHEKVPFKIYKDPLMKRKPMTIVCASRACINHCMHCLAPFQKPLRYRSVDNVIEELKLVESLGIKEVKFFDCGITNDLDWVNEFCERMISEGIDLTWNCNSRADHLPLDTLELMKEAGCHTICIGAESANQKILDTIRKNETVEQIEEAVKNMKKVGIRTLMYFTFGLPGETKDTMNESIKFAKRLNPDFVTFGIVVPAYGTRFWEYLEKNGYLQDSDESKWDPNSPPAYNYPNLSGDEIYKTATRGYREFYFRPKYILKRLFNLSSLTGLRNDIGNFAICVKRYILQR